MGFRDVRTKAITCLENGNVLYEARKNIDVKNLLKIGTVSNEDVVKILKSSRGGSYKTSPHHYDRSIVVHIVSTTLLGQNWYIKWYFLEPDCIFISIHT